MKLATMLLSTLTVFCFALAERPYAAEPIDIGTQRELFLDDFWFESSNNVQILVHQPVRKEISTVWDKPWEGCGCGYTTVFKDKDDKGPLYRMYYKSWNHSGPKAHPLVIAYQESRDGVNWIRPNLGLFEFKGSKENNIVYDKVGKAEMHDFNVFRDLNPDAAPEAKYKAIGAIGWPAGLHAFQSPDGVHWKLMKDGPVYTKGAFDSQNVAFWSETEKKYVLYYRTFENRVRSIRRAASTNFLDWTDEGTIRFPEGEGPTIKEAFYVNQILPYYRAPHLYIGFPARYCRDEPISRSTELLPEKELRWERMGLGQKLEHGTLRYGTVVTDSVYISSRDGMDFRQSNNVFLAPGLRTKDNWSYGDNYIAWHVVETEPTEPDMTPELSLYSTESYFTGDSAILRRFTLRIDGFASLHAKSRNGEMVTKAMVFGGNRLSLNMGTSAAGEIRVELLDAEGKPIPDRTAADCDPIFGDSLDRTVSWKGVEDLSALAGKPIKIRFILREADIYSFVFEKK